jgi:hypothetical protein
MLAAASSQAADVNFRPTLTFGAYYDGNTAVVGGASGQGDGTGVLAADLAVERTTPDSSLVFSYRPSYVAYRNESDLNYFGQSTDLNYARTTSRRARYTLDLNAYRTERQGVRPTSPSDAATFVPRSMQLHVGARAHGTHEGRRNVIDWEVRASLDDYSQSQPTSQPDPPACVVDQDCDDGNSCTQDTCNAGVCEHQANGACDLQNSSGVGALGTWRYQVTEKSSVGLGLNFDTLMYATLPNVYVESFGLVGDYEISRSTTMTYAAGVSRTDSEGTNSTNFAGDLTISRSITEVSSLTAGIRQSVSSGSGLGGVSLDTGGYASYSHAAPRQGLSGSVLAGYWRRDPVAVGAAAASASTQTLNAGGSIAWNFNRFLALSFAYAFSDQTSSDPATLDTRYSSYGLNLLWAIRGR